ncbi:hypothetical protein FRC12_005418 [Ceratobasidium sp. 428]|nr:hypothetical protein FRC12_005418 [Ceratobasidium sp. 428]
MSDSSRPSSPTGAPTGQPPRPGSGSAVSRPPGAGQVRRVLRKLYVLDTVANKFHVTAVEQLTRPLKNPTHHALRVLVDRAILCSSCTLTIRLASACECSSHHVLVVSLRGILTSSRRDPFVVMMLSLSFIASIFFLHISAKLVRYFSK